MSSPFDSEFLLGVSLYGVYLPYFYHSLKPRDVGPGSDGEDQSPTKDRDSAEEQHKSKEFQT